MHLGSSLLITKMIISSIITFPSLSAICVSLNFALCELTLHCRSYLFRKATSSLQHGVLGFFLLAALPAVVAMPKPQSLAAVFPDSADDSTSDITAILPPQTAIKL